MNLHKNVYYTKLNLKRNISLYEINREKINELQDEKLLEKEKIKRKEKGIIIT